MRYMGSKVTDLCDWLFVTRDLIDSVCAVEWRWWLICFWFVSAVHKQRDIVPLDVNDDTNDYSDEDDVQPVFDLKVLTFFFLVK